MRYLLRLALECQGYQVEEAANGYEGLQCYKADPADLIITDIQMPVMDGLELLAALHRAFPMAKVVALSGDKWLLARTKRFNVQGVFEKPFCIKTLLHTVEELVGAYAASEERDDVAVYVATAE